MRRQSWAQRLAGLSLLGALGCQAKIGDRCQTNQQCSGETQRLCDTSQPGGYCTVLNCSPTSCPRGDSVCVSFNSAIAPLPACQNGSKPSPYQRSLCMRHCGSNSDCRDGYECVDIEGDDLWSAQIVSVNPPRTKICISLPLADGVPPDRETGVCGSPEGGAGAVDDSSSAGDTSSAGNSNPAGDSGSAGD